MIDKETLDITLREYVDLRFTNLDKALILATTELNKRLDSLNELRGEVTTDREQLVQKLVYEAAIKEIQKEIATQGKILITQGEEMKGIQKEVGILISSQTWLVRVVAGAIVSGIVLFVVAKLT